MFSRKGEIYSKKDSSTSLCPLNFRKFLKIPILSNNCERVLSTTSINADWSTLNDTHMEELRCFTESSKKIH